MHGFNLSIVEVVVTVVSDWSLNRYGAGSSIGRCDLITGSGGSCIINFRCGVHTYSEQHFRNRVPGIQSMYFSFLEFDSINRWCDLNYRLHDVVSSTQSLIDGFLRFM